MIVSFLRCNDDEELPKKITNITVGWLVGCLSTGWPRVEQQAQQKEDYFYQERKKMRKEEKRSESVRNTYSLHLSLLQGFILLLLLLLDV